jgi:hypothetical protein
MKSKIILSLEICSAKSRKKKYNMLEHFPPPSNLYSQVLSSFLQRMMNMCVCIYRVMYVIFDILYFSWHFIQSIHAYALVIVQHLIFVGQHHFSDR